jgi:hypothetical protein
VTSTCAAGSLSGMFEPPKSIFLNDGNRTENLLHLALN